MAAGGTTPAVRIRRVLGATLLLAMQVLLYRQYAVVGSQFHYWLHLLYGIAVGFGVLAVVAIVAPRIGGRGALTAGALGHAWSAAPDLAFLVLTVLHATWMDVFALHISVHFVRAPLLVALLLAALSLLTWLAATVRRGRVAGSLLASAVVLLGIALGARTPLPGTLDGLRADPDIAWTCQLATTSQPTQARTADRLASASSTTSGVYTRSSLRAYAVERTDFVKPE